jgi:hypothetical protein
MLMFRIESEINDVCYRGCCVITVELALEVSKVGDYKQLEESFQKVPETDKPHTVHKRLDDAIKEINILF